MSGLCDVHVICWNERYLLPHFVRHYHFANKIIVYDNGSDDGSPELARALGCEVRYYDTGNQQDNATMRRLKSHCWKESRTPFVIVCDIDEFVVGWERMIPWMSAEDSFPPVFQCEAYQMMSDGPPDDFTKVTKAIRAPYFDKCLCFSTRVKQINYTPGCHDCDPIYGARVLGAMKLYHYNFLGEDYVLNRWKRYVPRMSDRDILMQWGEHYLKKESEIRGMWRQGWRDAIDIPPVQYAEDNPVPSH